MQGGHADPEWLGSGSPGQYETTRRRSKLLIFTGRSNPDLAEAVVEHLRTEHNSSIKIGAAQVSQFANGEVNVHVQDPVRGDDVFIVHPTCANPATGVGVNDALMELLLLIHTVKLSSARRITACIPHYAYARQDRKTDSRVPISASAVARLLVDVGVERVLTIDLHCSQIQGFFTNTPVSNITPVREFANYLSAKEIPREQIAVVAPDAGAVERARHLAERVNADRVVTILKRRVQAGKVDTMHIAGDVSGMVCAIVDDMTDTSGTLCKAAELLCDHGAKEVYAMITHGILTDPACDRINKCAALTEVVVTDTLPQRHNLARCGKLVCLSVAPLIAEAIRRIHGEQSMDNLNPSKFLPAVRGGSPAGAEPAA
eukprot:TRINITY_DN55274_c0_g1_i1.p1 TRINITY_DN55274_c0_g1~~TRINITY_DN55274_c0_g1_i1.p1  ORF type:complete len:373 (+),score=106.04 TRINITY_DN55274_c0_g1_i1:79-1197(+)